MKLTPRHALSVLGLALASLTAQAQHVELVTEAPVTFEITFGTSLTRTNGSVGTGRVDTTRGYTSVLTNKDILEGFKTDGLITDANVDNWRMVAVRPAPAEIYAIDTRFSLYLIKTEANVVTQRVRVPDDEFVITTSAGPFSRYAVDSYVETHSAQSIINARGTATNYAVVDFTADFTRTQVPPVVTGPFTEDNLTFRRSTSITSKYTLSELQTTGFSTIAFSTRTTEPVFFYALDTIRYSAKGDFSASQENTTIVRKVPTNRAIPEPPPESTVVENIPVSGGLVSMRITIGSPKLVERSLYPEVSFDDEF